jgi:hypothetical protein
MPFRKMMQNCLVSSPLPFLSFCFYWITYVCCTLLHNVKAIKCRQTHAQFLFSRIKQTRLSLVLFGHTDTSSSCSVAGDTQTPQLLFSGHAHTPQLLPFPGGTQTPPVPVLWRRTDTLSSCFLGTDSTLSSRFSKLHQILYILYNYE